MEELNRKTGERLRECLLEANMSQKKLAKDAGYTAQYISNIIVGKKRLSYEAARNIAKILRVRSEYLLCEDDYKTESLLWGKRHELFESQGSILENLINLAGYRRVCDYIANFEELGYHKTIYGPFRENETIERYVPDDCEGKINYYTVIESPNGKRFSCPYMDYGLLEYELIEFIHFRFKQLQSRYWWEIEDGKNTSSIVQGSITKKYPDKKVSEYPDILANSMWVDHNGFLPSICYVDNMGQRYSGCYDEKKGRWVHNNAEKFMPGDLDFSTMAGEPED